jgi:hypothetical protein
MKFFVLAPAGHSTGGVEALHQLVDALRFHGHDATICYCPAEARGAIPNSYLLYDVVAATPEDQPGSIVIVPESMFDQAKKFRKATVVIWWLSIDFYYGRDHKSAARDLLRTFYRMARGKVLPLIMLRRYLHAAQSNYAAHYLAARGLAAPLLSDYLNEHLLQTFAPKERRFRVLYNPKKGLDRTERIIRELPEIEFVALHGFAREKIVELFRTSEVYIDFGHHPGKDRMPREAIVNGCIVVTNLRGSAGFEEDVPIPLSYKVDDSRPGFVIEAASVLRRIKADPERARNEFVPVAEHIRCQRTIFFGEVALLTQRLAMLHR